MVSTALSLESLSLVVTQEIQVKARLEKAFAALLEQIGPERRRQVAVVLIHHALEPADAT